jgi:hypothetical protein
LAKSEKAASSQNQGFISSIGKMTRNFEMIAAGKLVAQGSRLKYESDDAILSHVAMLSSPSAQPMLHCVRGHIIYAFACVEYVVTFLVWTAERAS